jgi:hypothetical protein
MKSSDVPKDSTDEDPASGLRGLRDVEFPWVYSPHSLRKVLGTIRLWWPGAEFLRQARGEGEGEERLSPPIEIPCIIEVYEDVGAYIQSKKTPRRQISWFRMHIDPSVIRFTVGPLGSATDVLRADVQRVLQGL